jgi:hypothetical protein
MTACMNELAVLVVWDVWALASYRRVRGSRD